ncbi:hypothetical protein AB0L75_39015 [Streptomyces sp. NPDC052101]|uniref:hypothetical protein n=1 Tax=Streptomyces sp. NPDC052101 TaxID=3155763 RepID=UPI0034195C5C
MALAVVRDLRPELRLETAEEIAAFEQDLLAEFVLARADTCCWSGSGRPSRTHRSP